MKTIDKLLTAEQRAVIECAEGILSREIEARLVARGKADAGFRLNSGTERTGTVHKGDEPG